MIASSPFSVDSQNTSHVVRFESDRLDYSTDGEPGGQLVVCRSGELELYGQAGEWVIPEGHMVYIPARRWFRIRAGRPSEGVVTRFCHDEVAWRHEGCWVGPVGDFAASMIGHGLKWDLESSRSRRGRCFFVTLGDMVPGWFGHQRIFWTPYSRNGAIQRALDFARSRGPNVLIAEVAGHVGMSERTLRRHMQAELGQSWRDFIREFRMNRAMELLRKDRLSITETAFQVGFSSSSAFSNAFLEYVGKSPSAYARAYRGLEAGMFELPSGSRPLSGLAGAFPEHSGAV